MLIRIRWKKLICGSNTPSSGRIQHYILLLIMLAVGSPVMVVHKDCFFFFSPPTVISESMLQHHEAVRLWSAAVFQRRLDTVVDHSTGHVGGRGEHVDGRYMNAVLFSMRRRSLNESAYWVVRIILSADFSEWWDQESLSSCFEKKFLYVVSVP